MRYVKKGAAPASFEAWLASGNDNWQPTYENFRNPEKRELHQSLIQEAGHLCGYCGMSVDIGTSHIEHFRPQHPYVALELDYRNLLVSCQRETLRRAPRHCGVAKDGAFEEHLHVSPFEFGTDERFVYTLTGDISSTARVDDAANHMIDLLKLSISFLKNRREAAISRVFDHRFLGDATIDELAKLRDGLSVADETGRLEEFAHVLARFAAQRIQDQMQTSPQ